MSGAYHLVVGLGKTGMSCVRFLLARGVAVRVVDSRPQPPFLEALRKTYPHVPVQVGPFRADWFQRADKLVVSQSVSLDTQIIAAQRARGVDVLSELDLFVANKKGRIIAVTGSNGKSTVVSLLFEMAKEAGIKAVLCGNIGLPVLDGLDPAVETTYIMELSSFQLENTAYLPTFASVVLNIAPDHLDRHGRMVDYVNAKKRIYNHAQHRLIARDDPWMQEERQAGCYHFGQGEPSGQRAYGMRQHAEEIWLARDKTPLFPLAQLGLKGTHHGSNALAALALGEIMGLPLAPMQRVLRRFKGLPHRCQLIHTQDGIAWYNDSKATNVAASRAAVMSLGAQMTTGKLIVIMGGEAKERDFSALQEGLRQYARCVLLIGRDAPLLEACFKSVVPVICLANLEQAVARAKTEAKQGDTVLLSPACASFDQFKHFEARGNAFARAVRS